MISNVMPTSDIGLWYIIPKPNEFHILLIYIECVDIVALSLIIAAWMSNDGNKGILRHSTKSQHRTHRYIETYFETLIYLDNMIYL